jgi:heme-degrading monooxygenase HmoA
MIAMIFEFWFDPDDQTVFEEYLAEAAKLRELLPEIDGFEGIERFTSVSEPGKFVAIGFFRDEEAVAIWRNTPQHRRVQALGRQRLFTDYRLRMAEVIRDYGRDDRTEAPTDSVKFHR